MAGEALVLAQRHLNAALACLADVAKGEPHGSQTQLDAALAAFKARGALAAVEQAIERAKERCAGEEVA